MTRSRLGAWTVGAAAATLALVLAGCNLQMPSSGFATPTPEERGKHDETLDLVRNEIDSDPDTFAGAFLDSTTGALVILVASDDERATAAVRELIPTGTPVIWRRVARSGTELQRVHDELVVLWREIGVEEISHVSIDTPTNSVVVALPAPNDGLAARLAATYGDAVRITVEPPSDPI